MVPRAIASHLKPPRCGVFAICHRLLPVLCPVKLLKLASFHMAFPTKECHMPFVVKIAPSRTYNQQVLRHGKAACKVSSKQKPITNLYLIVWRKAIELIKTFQPNAIKLRNAVH